MIFLRLIVTNLRRHRIRSFISIAGIAFSVAAMLTVVTILQGAIVPAAAADEIDDWPMVLHADPVLFGIVSSADHPIITCFGVTAADARIRKATWLEGDRLAFAQHSDDVVLGERAAEFLGARLDDHVPIGHAVFHVIGILKTANGFEDGGVFMPLSSAQGFFHKEGTSSVITVKLRNKDDAASFKTMVKEKFPNLIGLESAEFTRSYSQFKILKATAWAVGGCGLLLGGLGVANTMIMSVFTRIREIAILRVNGFSHLQVAAMIFGESGVVSLLGAVLGLVTGTCLLFILKQVPALHGYVDVTVQPFVLLIVILLALITGIAGALYPAAYAMRIRAVEALRFE